jgi:hypothetical protein
VHLYSILVGLYQHNTIFCCTPHHGGSCFDQGVSAGDCVRPHVCGVGLINTTCAKSTIISYKGRDQTGGRSRRLEPFFPKAVACKPLVRTLFLVCFFPHLHRYQSMGQRFSDMHYTGHLLLASWTLGRILSRGTFTLKHENS